MRKSVLIFIVCIAATSFASASYAHAASPSCTFSSNLALGSRGAGVLCLQQSLIGKGYSLPAGATGYYGTQTRSAVSAWQKSAGVAPALGNFGPLSRKALAASMTAK